MRPQFDTGDVVVNRDGCEPGVVLYGECTECGVPRYLVATLVRNVEGVTLTVRDRFEDEIARPALKPTKRTHPTLCALSERAFDLSEMLWPLMDWDLVEGIDESPETHPVYIETLSGRHILRQVRYSLGGYYWAASGNGRAYRLDKSEKGWRVAQIIERPAC